MEKVPIGTWTAANRGASIMDIPSSKGWAGTPYTPNQQGSEQMFARQYGFPQAQKLAKIAQTPARLQQERFNTVFPWLQGQFGSMMGNLNSTVGGESGVGPHISAGPVMNPQMQQQQINAMRARGDMQAQTQQRLLARQAAGRGLGANSPLTAALQGQAQSANLANQTTGERELRLGSAQMNAEHMLRGQQAREGQFASRQQEDIERRRTLTGLFPGLLNAFAGLV